MIETIKKYNPDSEKYKFGSWAGKYKFGAGIKKIPGQVLEMQIDGQTATAGDWKRWPMIMFGGQKIQNCQQSQYISYFTFCFYKCQCSSDQAACSCFFSVFNLKMFLLLHIYIDPFHSTKNCNHQNYCNIDKNQFHLLLVEKHLIL